MGHGKAPAPPVSTPDVVLAGHHTANTHPGPLMPLTRRQVTPATYETSRRTPTWVVPRRSGFRKPRVCDGAPSNVKRTRARGAADPAPGPSDRGRSRRRARNGVSARRHYAGHLIRLQVSAAVVAAARGKSVLIVFASSLLTHPQVKPWPRVLFADLVRGVRQP
jgi:hypothetical protein